MTYKPTSKSAIEYATHDKLEEWIHLFLCGEGDNKPFSDGLKLAPRKYDAPKLMSLNLFARCCGPEEGIRWQIPVEGFFAKVEAMIKKYEGGSWDMPPLIINRRDHMYELNDGNHRFEALKQLGIDQYWVVIWETIG